MVGKNKKSSVKPRTQIREKGRRLHQGAAGLERLQGSELRLNAAKTEADLYNGAVREIFGLLGASRALIVLDAANASGNFDLAAARVPKNESKNALLQAITPWLQDVRRTRLTRLRHGPAGSKAVHQRSCLTVPLLAKRKLLGYVYADIDGASGRFDDGDRDLLATLANYAAAALVKLRLPAQQERKMPGLAGKIQAADARAEQRAAELAIINAVQEGLAARMEMQGIYDLVGNKIQEIFDAQIVSIELYDPDKNEIHFPYIIERGKRFSNPAMPLIGYRKHVIETRQHILINDRLVETSARYGNPLVLTGEQPKSVLFVPMLVGDEIKGVISLQNLDREHAFGESEVRLLQTLANSMSVALENARLFDETQRLLKETEQRNAELAIINSVQEGLVAKMDMQGIYDLVGDKIRDIFDAQVVVIGLYDRDQKQVRSPYAIERGVRLNIEPMPLVGFRKHVLETRQCLLISDGMAEAVVRYGNPLILAGEQPKTSLWISVPMTGLYFPILKMAGIAFWVLSPL